MATPAQTQVTLDASQFISAVDAIGKAITDMNAKLQSAATAFNGFATSTAGIEKSLQSLNTSLTANVNATKAVEAAVKASNAAQQQQVGILNQVAASAAKTAQLLEAMAQASQKAGKAGAQGAQQFTFAWDGIIRLLAVTVIRRIFLDIAGAISQSVSASAEYMEVVGRIVALNRNLGVSADQLSQQFTNLSLAYGRSLKEVADAGRIAATAGGAQTALQIEQITSAAVRFAEVAGTTVPAATTAVASITQAFRLGAQEAQNVSNQLIHLTQSGIGIEAINGSIGRVSAQAQRLGISFSELGLLMEELKATGISDSEVMTQVAAVLSSLERPTQRMNELMGSRGFLSPQQLIQAQRLHGALQLINQDISEGNIQARQAVQSRRAGGGLSVADSFAARSQNNPLENVNALNEGANAALRIVDATGKWNDELEKIKTIFQSEVAPAIIKSILEIFEPMGGLAKVVTDAGRQIALLVDPVARVVSWFAVWGGWLERCAELLGILNPNMRVNADVMRGFADAAREGAERLNTWVSAQRQLSQRTLQDGTQAIANFFAPLNAALERQAEIQRERVHQLSEQIEATSKQVFGAFGSQIESMESVARQAESRIMESLKRVGEFADRLDKDMFNHRLKSLGDVSQTTPFTSASQQNNAAKLLTAQNRGADNQLNLIRDRRARLEQEIAELQARGDANSIESARRKFEQLRQLNDQEMDIRQQSARRNAEFTARATGQDQTFNPFNREREAGARRLNAAEEEFEAANRRRLAAQQQALEVINRQLRERLRLVQDGQRDIGRLPNALLTPEGRPRAGFEGAAGGARAVNQINSTIDQQIARIRALPAEIERGIAEALRTGSITQEQADQARRRGPTQQEITGLIQQLEQQRTATTALFQNAEARRVNEANQRQQIELLTRIARNTELAINRVAETRQEQTRLLSQAQQQINNIRGQVPSTTALLREGSGETGSRFRSELMQAIAEADRRIATAARTGNQGDINSAQAQVDLVVQHLDRLQRLRGQDGRANPGIDQLRDTVERLRQTLQERAIRENALGTEQQIARGVTQAAQNAGAAAGLTPANGQPGVVPAATIQQSITAFQNLANALNPGGQVPNALSSLATDMATAGQRIRDATANLNRLNAPVQVPREPNRLPPGVMENQGGFAEGGLIGNTFSRMGPDNVMIHARRGEFVINPEDTRKWYSTLVAINRGDRPRGGGYAHGGTVNNTIGNMTFHVNGSENPRETAQAVMKIIRREQRRGNA